MTDRTTGTTQTGTTPAGTAQSGRQEADSRPVKHVHHGRTPAAWAGTSITIVAFLVGAIGLVMANWVVFWIAVVLLVVAIVVTLVMRKMGYGAD